MKDPCVDLCTTFLVAIRAAVELVKRRGYGVGGGPNVVAGIQSQFKMPVNGQRISTTFYYFRTINDAESRNNTSNPVRYVMYRLRVFIP